MTRQRNVTLIAGAAAAALASGGAAIAVDGGQLDVPLDRQLGVIDVQGDGGPDEH